MRKLYNAFLPTLVFLIVSMQLAAQSVTVYSFTQTSGTYTDITGTTSTASGDDGTHGSIPIGFTFNLGGANYTHIAVTTNGHIKLGAAGVAITTSFGGFSNTAFTTSVDRPIIAPLWDDMNLSGGDIRYELSGSPGSQVFTVQWTNNHWSGSGNAAAPTNSYQVKLYEGTNVVEFVYGTMNGSATGSASIGITEPTGFMSVTPGTPATASTTVANNAISSAADIPSGTIYRFSPPPPCVPGSLAGGTTVSSVTAACAGVNFTLSVTGASFGSGLTYEWQSSPDGVGSWTAIGTGETVVATQSATTYYRRKMTCSGTDAYSTVIQIIQNGPMDCYCPVTFPSSVEPITLVSFANINNTSSDIIGNTPDLENFTSIVGNVSKGVVYPITVKGNTGGNFITHINVFIDWNQDGDFNDAGENHYIGTIVNSTGLDAIEATGNILIPASALDGTTKMRVIKRYNLPAEPCNSTGFGQAEDYSLNITTPLCATPTDVTVTNITVSEATVSFTVTGTVYVEYGVTGFTPGTGAAAGAGGTVVTGASPITLTGLAANTPYTVYVRQDCGGGIFSANSVVPFRTLCNIVNTFPFTETFEAASPNRACWKVDDFISGNIPWTYGAGAGNGGPVTTAHGGSLNARFFGDGTGSMTRLVSPALDMTSLIANGADLSFWLANAAWLGDQNELRVYYKSSAAGPWTLIPGAVYTTNVGTWTQIEIENLPNLSNEYYIAFEGSEFFGWGIAIDDVVIKAAPSCRKVTGVTAISPTPTSAIVSFTSPGNAFIVEYGAPGFTPGTDNNPGAGGTIVLGGASPIEVTGLTASTTYDFYVRQICVPGVDYSENVKATATTLCPATNIPYLQNFETSVVPGMPACISVQDLNGSSGPTPNAEGGQWVTFTGTSNQVYVSPTNSIRYLYDAANLSRGADDWFFLQGLNLTGGTSYRLKFYYKGSDGPTWTERLEVKYGTAAQASAMTGSIYTNNNIATALANPWDSARVDFTPPTTGVYYIGFHATSLPDNAFLYIDDISVRVAPVVDAGVSSLVDPLPNCPTTNTVLKAVVHNYNIVPLNFATYPVTVTASITGAATTTLTTTLNTGTLAPGASMEVDLPAYGFAAGLYNMSVATSSPSDGEPCNDAYNVSFYVNPAPAVAVFTPADPRTCATITTQFATPPPPPTTLPAVSSGTINLAIPDGSASGITHTLTTSGVPAGATLTGISVTLNATHTWNNDLRFNLKAPNGKVLNLVNLKGGSGDNFTNAVISSTATTPLPTAATSPVTGTFMADGVVGVGAPGFVSDVANFAGLYSIGNGDWTLFVNDNVAFDPGTLVSWSITLTYGTPHPVVTWSPVTGLFTDAAGTIPYVANTNAYTVYANPATTTTYTVTSTSAANCSSSSTVTVRPQVEIAALPSRICISDEVVPLNATPAGGSWSGIGVSGNTFIPPATALGSYTLTYRVTSPGGCVSSASVVATVVDCPERIRRLRDTAVILYPNPNTGIFSIRMNSVLYNKLTMRVYTSAGTLAYSKELTGLAYGRVVPMDLTHLPAGHYLVHFYYPGGVRTSDKTYQVVIGR